MAGLDVAAGLDFVAELKNMTGKARYPLLVSQNLDPKKAESLVKKLPNLKA